MPIQKNFFGRNLLNGGEIDNSSSGRTDSDKFQNGWNRVINFIPNENGSISFRNGCSVSDSDVYYCAEGSRYFSCKFYDEFWYCEIQKIKSTDIITLTNNYIFIGDNFNLSFYFRRRGEQYNFKGLEFGDLFKKFENTIYTSPLVIKLLKTWTRNGVNYVSCAEPEDIINSSLLSFGAKLYVVNSLFYPFEILYNKNTQSFSANLHYSNLGQTEIRSITLKNRGTGDASLSEVKITPGNSLWVGISGTQQTFNGATNPVVIPLSWDTRPAEIMVTGVSGMRQDKDGNYTTGSAGILSNWEMKDRGRIGENRGGQSESKNSTGTTYQYYAPRTSNQDDFKESVGGTLNCDSNRWNSNTYNYIVFDAITTKFKQEAPFGTNGPTTLAPGAKTFPEVSSVNNIYPHCACLHEGRIIYIGSTYDNTEIWATDIGYFDPTNTVFTTNKGDYDEEEDIDGFNFNVGNWKGTFYWAVSTQWGVLAGGTDGLILLKGTGNSIMSSTSFSNQKISSTGCGNLQPAQRDSLVFFTNSEKNTIYTAQYQLETNNFQIININVFNKSIISAPIRQLDIYKNYLFIVLENGKLLYYKVDSSAWGEFQFGEYICNGIFYINNSKNSGIYDKYTINKIEKNPNIKFGEEIAFSVSPNIGPDFKNTDQSQAFWVFWKEFEQQPVEYKNFEFPQLIYDNWVKDYEPDYEVAKRKSYESYLHKWYWLNPYIDMFSDQNRNYTQGHEIDFFQTIDYSLCTIEELPQDSNLLLLKIPSAAFLNNSNSIFDIQTFCNPNAVSWINQRLVNRFSRDNTKINIQLEWDLPCLKERQNYLSSQYENVFSVDVVNIDMETVQYSSREGQLFLTATNQLRVARAGVWLTCERSENVKPIPPSNSNYFINKRTNLLCCKSFINPCEWSGFWGKKIWTIYGLQISDPEKEVVSVQADGRYLGDYTPQYLTLPSLFSEFNLSSYHYSYILLPVSMASKWWNVGKKYKGELKSLQLGYTQDGNTMQIVKKNSEKIFLRLYNSQSGQIGFGDNDELLESIINKDKLGEELNPGDIFTGDVEIIPGNDWEKRKFYRIVQNRCEPLNLTMITLYQEYSSI